jgi:hypothetical protein
VNVLKLHLQATVFTLLDRRKSQREIQRLTGIDRKTIRGYEQLYRARQAGEASNSPTLNTGSGSLSQGRRSHPTPRPLAV